MTFFSILEKIKLKKELVLRSAMLESGAIESDSKQKKLQVPLRKMLRKELQILI